MHIWIRTHVSPIILSKKRLVGIAETTANGIAKSGLFTMTVRGNALNATTNRVGTIWGSGKMGRKKGGGLKQIFMKMRVQSLFTKDTGMIIKRMAQADKFQRVDLYTTDSGQTAKNTVMVSIDIRMVKNTQATGNKGFNTAKANKLFPME